MLSCKWLEIGQSYWKSDLCCENICSDVNENRFAFADLTAKTYELFVNINVSLLCQQRLRTAVTPFKLQVLNTGTVIPARDYLLVQTTQVPAVIVTASPIKN